MKKYGNICLFEVQKNWLIINTILKVDMTNS